MFHGMLLVFAALAIFLPPAAVAAPAVSRQFLPPMPGFIPVYIRPGNTPLEDINLDLAEAFRSYAEKHARFNSIRARSQNVLTADEKTKASTVSTASTAADEADKLEQKKPPAPNNPQHIQKIKSRT